MAALSFTRIHGMGCGSRASSRKTKGRGRLTTAINPMVAAMPTRATDQKSATISEIHRSHSRHAGASWGLSRDIARTAGRSDSTSPSSADA